MGRSLRYVKLALVLLPVCLRIKNHSHALPRLHEEAAGAAETRGSRQRRVIARRSLLKLCQGDWSDRSAIIHNCSLNCSCRCFGDAAHLVTNTVCDAFLSATAPIPALNRWNRVYPPLAWWMGALAFHQVCSDACIMVARGLATDGDERNVIDPLDPPTEQSFRREHLGRLRKMCAWLEAELTVPRVMLGVTIMHPAMKLLASFFAAARLGSDSNIISFCHPATSPAERAIVALLKLSASDDDPGWLPFLQGSGWTAAKTHAASTAVLGFVGHLVMKCAMPFHVWPMELAKLAHPAVPADMKQQVANSFWALKSCCVDATDGFTFRLRSLMAARAQVDSPATLQFIKDVFANMESANIRTEDRFARARKHTHWNQSVPAFAAEHMISEWAAAHHTRRLRPSYILYKSYVCLIVLTYIIKYIIYT